MVYRAINLPLYEGLSMSKRCHKGSILTQLLSAIACAGVLALLILPLLTRSGVNAGNAVIPPAGITLTYY